MGYRLTVLADGGPAGGLAQGSYAFRSALPRAGAACGSPPHPVGPSLSTGRGRPASRKNSPLSATIKLSNIISIKS